MSFEYVVFPGSVLGLAEGWYWSVGRAMDAEMGTINGPYPTEDAAKAAAVERFEGIVRKVIEKPRGIHP
jgi:hypothetical protein